MVVTAAVGAPLEKGSRVPIGLAFGRLFLTAFNQFGKNRP